MKDFVPLKGYETLYRISKEGLVYSIKKNVILQTSISPSGYKQVRLRINNKAIHKSLHRLLAITFIPNPDNKPCIDHIDGNKFNNDLNNLRWCTYKENSNNVHALEKFSQSASRAWKNGRIMSREAVEKRSKACWKSVVQYSLDNNFIKTWHSIKEAANELHISQGHIGEVCNGKRKSCNGYVFKWLDRPADKKSDYTVDAYDAMQHGSEPLAKIEKLNCK